MVLDGIDAWDFLAWLKEHKLAELTSLAEEYEQFCIKRGDYDDAEKP